MRAAQKARAIGLILKIADGIRLDHEHVRDPDRGLLLRTFAARGENRANVRHKFRFHEQIGKSRMPGIRSLRGERQLRIRSHLDIARPRAQVANGDAAHFRIVF